MILLCELESQTPFEGGGFGPPIRVGHRCSDVESAARSFGFGWNQDLLRLVRRGERLLKDQHVARVKEMQDAAEAETAAKG